jgi:hypothetical protein
MMNIIARVIGFAVIVTWPAVCGAETLTTDEASKHVGEIATICGTVASTNFAKQTKGQPTFLDMDKPYPNETFTVLILGQDRAKFGTPEKSLLEKRVCATGAIQLYLGRPQVILHDPSQLKQE